MKHAQESGKTDLLQEDCNFSHNSRVCHSNLQISR
jgi:hypothetical protein